MSYILEALKKAEHQREIGRVPHIDSEHEPAAVGLSPRWTLIVVLILLINAGLLVVLFWPDGSTGVSPPLVKSPGSEVTRLPTAQHPDNSGAVSKSAAPTNVQRDRETDSVNRNVPAPAPRSEPPPPPLQQAAPAPTPRPVRIKPVVSPVIPAAPPRRAEPVQAAAPVKYERNLPVWPRIPAHIFQRLGGGLRLDVHVYSDQPRERFVLINMQKYHEGEQLQEGPVLDEITSEGVVLTLEGQQFLVQAQ